MSTDSHLPSEGDESHSAHDIAELLAQVRPDRLSHHQRSLYWDTIGLLGAIEEGVLTPRRCGRIFDNLVEAVSLFDENEETRPLIKTLHLAILRCAEEGYSVAANTHEQRQRRSWNSRQP